MLVGLLEAAPEYACDGLRHRRELPRAVQEVVARHPRWTVTEVSLGDLVLAYLANSGAGTLPGPTRIIGASA